MNPYDLAHRLAEALQNSSQFQNYKQAQDKIKGDPAAQEMLVDFRRQQLQLQKQMMAGLEIAPEQEDKLEKLHTIINMNVHIKDFMEAEYLLSVLIRDIEKIIADSMSGLPDPELFGATLQDLMGEMTEEEDGE